MPSALLSFFIAPLRQNDQRCINTSFVTQMLLTRVFQYSTTLATGLSFYKNPLVNNVLQKKQHLNYKTVTEVRNK